MAEMGEESGERVESKRREEVEILPSRTTKFATTKTDPKGVTLGGVFRRYFGSITDLSINPPEGENEDPSPIKTSNRSGNPRANENNGEHSSEISKDQFATSTRKTSIQLTSGKKWPNRTRRIKHTFWVEEEKLWSGLE